MLGQFNFWECHQNLSFFVFKLKMLLNPLLEKNNYLSTNYNIVLLFLDEAFKESFWIGGNDLISEGKWMWMTSHTPLHYTNWAHGEPSNEFGGEHCMSLLFYTNYHWNDERCKTVHPFICEKET